MKYGVLVFAAFISLAPQAISSESLECDMGSDPEQGQPVSNLTICLENSMQGNFLSIGYSGEKGEEDEFADVRDVIGTYPDLKGVTLYNFSRIAIGDKLHPSFSQLIQGIFSHKTIESLTLRDSPLRDVGLIPICEALAQNSGIKKLFIINGHFGVYGVIPLSKALKVNSSLQELSLKTSFIFKTSKDEGKTYSQDNFAGIVALAQALISNTTLNLLDISDQPLLERSLTNTWESLFISALEENKGLREVVLPKVSDKTKNSLQKLVNQHPTIDEIWVGPNVWKTQQPVKKSKSNT